MNQSARQKFMGLFLVAGLLFFSSPLRAQSTFGSIVGVLTDPSGAVVPGARVAATNVNENVTQTAMSNAQGLYEILNLKPGPYRVVVTMQGFAQAEISDLNLTARQELRANFTLALAGTTQNVVVQSAPPAIDTEDGTIADTKSFSDIAELPTNYRGATTSPLSTIMTAPEVEEDTSGGISIAGGIPSEVQFSVDGISTVDIRHNGPLTDMYPSSEMLDEFKVSAVNNNAEYSDISDVTVSTKSGGNKWHGSAFWYTQNAALDAVTYGAPSDTKQHKVWNNFGYSLSGPVYLPKIYNGHNRTFFFTDFEALRQPGTTLDILTVPTADQWGGNLNGLPGPPSVDPSTGQPFPNNQVPVGRINSVATALSKYYPLPNFTPPVGATGNYRAFVNNSTNSDQYDIRIDQSFGSKQQLFARWSWKTLPGVVDNTPLPESTVSDTNANLVVSDSYTIKPNLLNEFRFGLSRWYYRAKFPLNGATVVKGLGIEGLDTSNHPNSGAFTGFDFSDGTDFATVGLSKDSPVESRNYEYNDNLTWLKGRHTMKFGGTIQKVGFHDGVYFGGSDDFGNFDFLGGGFSGNAFTDLLLGLPYDSFNSVTGPDLNVNGNEFGLYAQDQWQASKRLTLNFGLRWELNPPMIEQSGNMSNFDPANGDVIIPDNAYNAPLGSPEGPSAGFLSGINPCAGNKWGFPNDPSEPCTNIVSASHAGLGPGLRKTDYKDIDPRLSFAYRPFSNDKTVVRAGFGVFNQTIVRRAYSMTGIDTSNSTFYQNFQGSGVPPQFMLPQAHAGSSANTNAINTERFLTGSQIDYKDPKIYQWNFTIERALGEGTNLRTSYIGTKSVNLTTNVDLNQLPASTTPFSFSREPYPVWNWIDMGYNLGYANFHELQVEATRHLANGLMFQASYNLAKNLTNMGGTFSGTGLPVEFGGFVSNRFDTHYDYGNAAGTRRQEFKFTSVADLPVGRGRRFGGNMNRAGDAILGGWELSTVTMVGTGFYGTPTMPKSWDQSNTTGDGRLLSARPDRVGNGNLSHPTVNQYFDINAFTRPQVGCGCFGNSGVGILRGPGTTAVAGGLGKSFTLPEHFRLRSELSFTNIFNHPNFQFPSVDISDPSFGQIFTVQSAENAGNRVGQFSMRLEF